MKVLIIVLLAVVVLVVAGCTSSGGGGGGGSSVVVRSSNVDCSGSVASCRASLAACQNLNAGLVADRDLKVRERNECFDKYDELADAVNTERMERSEYEQVMDACYEQRLTYDSSGVFLFDVCPTCKDVLKCDSQSMMPAFNCKSTIRMEKVRSEADVRVCDTILYHTPKDWFPPTALLHRVWKIYKDESGVTRFKTAGDNNQQFDTYDPSFKDVIGEVAKVVTT